jgi:glycosyltransferase involved in cell wall biosynthesis
MSRAFYCWLSAAPPILLYAVTSEYDIGDALPETRIYRLPTYYWHRTADEIEGDYLRAKANRPRHVFHYLANEREVYWELRARGIPATFSNHNAMLDERIFKPLPGVEKRFDAVYNARMSPFKRHALAREIPRLLMIGGVMAPSDSEEYFAHVRRELPHARFTHAQGDAWISPARIAAAVNQAKVGLCLSAVEGAMYAATEYLLCGLPVVSTASLGGRDEWFDPKHARVVRDDPAAVAEAVAELIALRLPPERIRQRTLREVWRHRRRFVELVQNIYDRELVGEDFARLCYPRFFNKMGHWRDPRRVMQYQCEDCAAEGP